MTKYIKSPLNYTGGKYKLLSQILPLFPKDINTFVDLFCGGGNVGVNVNANKIVMNDIEEIIIKTLRYFKNSKSTDIVNNIEKVIDEYGLSKSSIYGYEYYGTNSNKGLAHYNKDKYLKLRSDYNNSRKDVITFYTMLIFAFNNQIRFNSKGEFNTSVNKRDFNNTLKNNLIKFIDKLKELNIDFLNKDFREVDLSSLNSDDFVYIDPPYLITLATYNEQNRWTKKDEKDLYILCDELHNRRIRFALSNVTHHKGLSNDELIEWSKKYNTYTIKSNYSNSNYQKNKKEYNETIEILITNY